MSSSTKPKVLLFDIGGVCVVSPFQAILDYEKRQGIPVGWINHSISASAPSGSWQRLERGEIPLDAAFFRQFHADLTDEKRWEQYHRVRRIRTDSKKHDGDVGQAAEEALFNAPPPPPLPSIDAEFLYWEMMRISRHPDPHMFPALKRLRKAADSINAKKLDSVGGQREEFLIGALSNTSIFPADHEFSKTTTPEAIFNQELKGLFDIYVSSAHVGMRKPDVEIYEYTVKQVDQLARTRGMFGGKGVEAGDIVFLDDIGSNLRTAKKVGMRTIKVTLGRADLAVKELEGIVGLDLTSAEAKL